MSNVWFTSDLHIGHEKVARERTHGMVLPRVVGAEIAAHDRMLAENWDELVDKDDTVWVLGDDSSGTKTAQLAALEWIKARPGKKHKVPGNHDGCHPMNRDSYKWLPIYLDGAYETVQLAAKRRISLLGTTVGGDEIPTGHVTVMMSHLPYTGDHTDVDRLPEWRLPDCGHYLLHGHTHSERRLSRGGNQPIFDIIRMDGKVIRQIQTNKGDSRINQIHVGVDAWDFKPVSMQTITELVNQIENGEIDPALTWRY